MRFPPPARYYVPLLVLVFGLAATLLDYELNLASDLARNFEDVAAQAEATGLRLARSSEGLLARGGGVGALANELAAWQDEPWLTLAALVDGHGRVLADSANRWVGQSARTTPLAPAIALVAHHRGDGLARLQKAHEARVFGAYQVALASDTAGWALVVFDRADAVAQARADARRQLRWSAMAIALLCFALWAALHFGFAARLARLARMLRDFGEGRAVQLAPLPGGDEVHELATAFAAMATRLEEREIERRRLEREAFEISERERRRIGQELHDGLGQRLTAASLATSGLLAFLESSAPALVPQAENISRQLRETIAEVRALSHGLAPVGVEADGLEHALRALAELNRAEHTGALCFRVPRAGQRARPSGAVAPLPHRAGSPEQRTQACRPHRDPRGSRTACRPADSGD